MTRYLSNIFLSTKRQQLVDHIRAVALSIDESLIYSGKTPLIITINGDKNTGKSLIWDTMIETLLGHAAQKDEKRSPQLSEDDFRSYETWSGTHPVNKRNMRILVCNIYSFELGYEDDMGILPLLKKTEEHKNSKDENADKNLRRLGDLLLLNHYKTDASSIEMYLQRQEDSPKGIWDRETTVKLSPHVKPEHSEKIRTFLECNNSFRLG